MKWSFKYKCHLSRSDSLSRFLQIGHLINFWRSAVFFPLPPFPRDADDTVGGDGVVPRDDKVVAVGHVTNLWRVLKQPRAGVDHSVTRNALINFKLD